MAVLTRSRRLILVAGCAAAALLVHADASAKPGGELRETEIRAAFLYNFTKFIEWPPPEGLPIAEPFRICVAGDAAFARLVGTLVAGESTAGRPLAVSVPGTSEAARACQVLFVSQAERELGTRLLAAVSGFPVLTVGDSPRFLDEGGAIQFVLDKRRVRFDISLPAIERAHLRVSSNLLRVARHIRQNGARQ